MSQTETLSESRLLGSGGFGSIYDTEDQQYVCKSYKKQDGLCYSMLAEILSDQILRDCSHVIHISQIKMVDGNPVIYFPKYQSNLETALTNNQWDIAIKKQILYQIIVGIHNAHQRSIAHLDISLDNILMNNVDDVVVADWGASVMLNDVDNKNLPDIACKWFYRSPEVFNGKPYNTCVDMWSFGIILAVMFSSFLNDEKFHHKCQYGENYDDLIDFSGNPDGYDLLHHLLDINMNTRYNTTDVLNHPFFNACPIPQTPVQIFPKIMWFNDHCLPSQFRLIAIDWMLEVCMIVNQPFDTFFHSVNYFDYYTSLYECSTKTIQLLICACMSIASKLFSDDSMEADFLVYLTSHICTSSQVIEMEKTLFMSIKDCIYMQTPLSHINRIQMTSESRNKIIYNLCLLVRHKLYRNYTSYELPQMAQSDLTPFLCGISLNNRTFSPNLQQKLTKRFSNQ